MHDPMTVAFEIKYPWRKYRGPQPNNFLSNYRESFITIWHIDPERDGSDDSCDWFGSRFTRENGWYPATIEEFERLSPAAREAVGFVWHVFRHRLGRPWYRHPRWHFWHWQFQVHPWQTLRRWLFTRCAGCGRRFAWGESPITNQWETPKPKFMRGETGLYHDCCHHLTYAKPQGHA